VYSLAIEPEKSSQQTELEEALSILTLEDPSLHVEIDNESGQTMLKGIGELHLEIIIDKLKRQYGIEVSTGKAYIAYRESINSSSGNVSKYFVYDRMSSNKRMFAAIEIEVTPTGVNEECVVTINEALKKSLNGEEYTGLAEGFTNALSRGLLGYPIVGLNIIVKKLDKDQDTTAGAIRACASMIVSNLLKESDYHELLEPYMLLEIELPSTYVGDVLSDITVKRRGHIRDLSTKDSINIINADVPLCKMLGYATTIRSLTQGEAIFSMEYVDHRPVDLATAKSDLSN
jgi:elongation factor G